MKNTSTHITTQFLAETYVAYRPLVLRYITRKLNGCLDAEDLVQDAFLRLLEYRYMLRSETVRSFLYTIVRNLVTDYLRHHYKKQEVMACMMDSISSSVVDAENVVIAKNLLSLEKRRVGQLSSKVRTIYSLSRFEEKTASEIAEELNIPKRTVEGCLLTGRKAIRKYMRQCI